MTDDKRQRMAVPAFVCGGSLAPFWVFLFAMSLFYHIAAWGAIEDFRLIPPKT